MKKLIILMLLVCFAAVSQQAPTNHQNKQGQRSKTNSTNTKAHIILEKNAIDQLKSQKNLNNDKFASKYHYQNQNDVFVCESVNNRRAFCPANTRYGVEFLRQISRSSCEYNWGYDERGVWVDNGCRAEFSTNQSWDQGDNGNIFVCESNRYDRNYCRVYLQNREVMLYRQLSRSSCNNNWGYDRNGIWVSNGCRAEFVLEDRYDPRNDQLVCSSNNGQFRMCRADTRGGVEFVRQLSRSSCNYNWGYNQQGIWVANGCRAKFRLVNYNYEPARPKTVRCSSKGYRQKVCRIDPHSGVRLIKQRSKTSCRGKWGYDERRIWVTGGCRATFEVLPRNQYGYDSNNDYGDNGYGNNGFGNNNYGNNNYGSNGYGNNVSRIKCESRNLRKEQCSIPYKSTVKLVRQLSKSSCRSNWGYNKRDIWVINGCRAEFEVTAE